MRFWSPSLNNINQILADLHSDRDTAIRLANWGNLPTAEIDFSTTAINIWHNILLMARKRGMLNDYLNYLVKISNSKELADAYETYINTPALLGGGGPWLPVFLKTIWQWVRSRWKVVTAVLAGVFVLAVAGVAVFYYFVPRTVSGYVSCLTPDHRKGDPVEKATVHLLGTPYKTTTNPDGSFNLSVPRKITVNNAEVLFGYGKYPVQLNHGIDNQLDVVKCPGIPEPEPKNIPFHSWQKTDPAAGVIKCGVSDDFSQALLYTLEPNQPILRAAESGDLIVNVFALGEWQILDARVTRPLSTGPTQQFAETTGLRTVSSRQWGFEIPGNSIEIRIEVCFGSPWPRQRFSGANLESNYYFQ